MIAALEVIGTLLACIAVACGVFSFGGLIVFGAATALDWAMEWFA